MPKHNRPPSKNRPSKRPRKFFVHIERDPDVEASRLELPVCMHEQQIIEAIHEKDVVLITGATGTGKTTQVPQFLVEDGFASPEAALKKGAVAITQPRRVAAVSCASRVAYEMRTRLGDMVGYHVRHDPRYTPQTRLKFLTDGILLREVENDLLLQRYSAIIVDEAHERSLNTDLLLAFLSRTVRLRREKCLETIGPLKVIIMSATLDVEGVFSGNDALFPSPTVVAVPSRQYPITNHFAKHTVEDYVDGAYRKVSKIHRRLPQGGILVFLSGRQEVEELRKKLEEDFADQKVKLPDSDGPPIGMKILPFYSLLPDHLQRRVFHDVDASFRKVVIATNIAETSVTVPGISYVVDSGRVKQKCLKRSRLGYATSFDVVWTSQASAQQRAGRAGRTGPGHCYRLYSSAVLDQRFPKFTAPEVVRVPADSVVLRLRALGIRHVAQFPFPTAPDAAALAAGERLLGSLGALAPSGLLGVTKLGHSLARLPLEPRLGRLLLSAKEEGGKQACAFAARVAGVLSVGGILFQENATRKNVDTIAKGVFRVVRSDVMRETVALCAVEHSARHSADKKVDAAAMRPLAEQLGVRVKAALEALAVAEQVGRAVGLETPNAPIGPPEDADVLAVAKGIVAAFPDRIARRMTRDEAAAAGVIPRLANRAFAVGAQGGAALLSADSVVRVGVGELICFSDMERVTVRQRAKSTESEEHDDYEESDGDYEDQNPGQEEQREMGATPGKLAKAQQDQGVADNGNGASVGGERRLILRGASVVRRGWIAKQAGALCRKRATSDGAIEYDAQRGVVVREAIVSYGDQRWSLGQMLVAVDELDDADGSGKSGTTDAEYVQVFARALLNGMVVEGLELDEYPRSRRAEREVIVQTVARVLGKEGVCSSEGLRRCGASTIDEMVAVLGTAMGLRRKQSSVYCDSMRQRWESGLKDFRETLEDRDGNGYSDADNRSDEEGEE